MESNTYVISGILTSVTKTAIYFIVEKEKRLITPSHWRVFDLLLHKFHDYTLPTEIHFVYTHHENTETIQILNEQEFKQSEYCTIKDINDLYI